MTRIVGALVAALLVGACGGANGTADSPPGTTRAPDTTAPEATPPSHPEDGMDHTTLPDDPDLAAAAESAIVDLTSRLGVDASDISLQRAESVTWPDGSLGCPEPGMMYTQALVEGYRVILAHDSRIYLYHAGADGDPFLCPSGASDGGHDFVPPPGNDT